MDHVSQQPRRWRAASNPQPPSTTPRLAWRCHLDGFEWTHVVTLTVRKPTGAEALAREFKDRFIRRVAKAAGCPVSWFYVIERGAAEERVHLHALIHSRLPITIKQLERSWKMGHTRCQRFDPSREAASYVTKALDNARDEYGVSRRSPPRRASPRASAPHPQPVHGSFR